MGNKATKLSSWVVDCRKKKRTDKMLFFVAVISPTFLPKVTQIVFPEGWVYQERETLLTPEQEAEVAAVEEAHRKEQSTLEGRERARKRARETYVQSYKQKKDAWERAAPSPSGEGSMEDEAEVERGEVGEEEKNEQEEKKAAAAAQASRKRRREFKMEHEAEEIPLTDAQKKQKQERIDAANTICRPFFRLLYEDTSLDFEAAFERVVSSRKRLLFYKHKTWRIVLYVIDHTLPLQAKFGNYKGSALADMFRPERPFNPDNVSETTRFVKDGAEAVNIVFFDRNSVVDDIRGVLTKELNSHFNKLYAQLTKKKKSEQKVRRAASKISTLNRGQLVDMQMQSAAQRKRRQREREEGKEQREVLPWENESVFIAMQHAATEVQIRARATKTFISPMIVFHLLCASMLEGTSFQYNLNVWFDQILPHILDIDANIKEKFKDSTSLLAQPMADVNFVLCLLSYLSKFQLKEQQFSDTIFFHFNSEANGTFDMILGNTLIAPFIVAAAQSVNRTSIVLSSYKLNFGSNVVSILDKSSPRQHAIAPNKPYCVEATHCHTVHYEAIAHFEFGSWDNRAIPSIHSARLIVFEKLQAEMNIFVPNIKNQRVCEMAPIKTIVYEFEDYDAPSPWKDLEYFLSWLPKECDATLVADIVSTVQGIPYQIIRELLTAPKVFPGEDEETGDAKKRYDAIRQIAKSYLLYAKKIKKKQKKEKGGGGEGEEKEQDANEEEEEEEIEERYDPYLTERNDEFLFLTQADDGEYTRHVPELEEAIELLQITS